MTVRQLRFFRDTISLLARHWPRGDRVLFRRQKAWFLPAAFIGEVLAARSPGSFSQAIKRGFCRLRLCVNQRASG
jgi:hypothetical protein